MKKTFTYACIGAAALAVSGCSIPEVNTPDPEPVQLAAPVAVQPAAPSQAAAEVPEPAKPKNPWAHVPIGNSSEPDGGDEDGGWSG